MVREFTQTRLSGVFSKAGRIRRWLEIRRQKHFVYWMRWVASHMWKEDLRDLAEQIWKVATKYEREIKADETYWAKQGVTPDLKEVH